MSVSQRAETTAGGLWTRAASVGPMVDAIGGALVGTKAALTDLAESWCGPRPDSATDAAQSLFSSASAVPAMVSEAEGIFRGLAAESELYAASLRSAEARVADLEGRALEAFAATTDLAAARGLLASLQVEWERRGTSAAATLDSITARLEAATATLNSADGLQSVIALGELGGVFAVPGGAEFLQLLVELDRQEQGWQALVADLPPGQFYSYTQLTDVYGNTPGGGRLVSGQLCPQLRWSPCRLARQQSRGRFVRPPRLDGAMAGADHAGRCRSTVVGCAYDRHRLAVPCA